MVDACPTGQSVMEADMGAEEMASVGRWRELWSAWYHTPEAIHAKEGRAVLAYLRHAARDE